MQNYSPNLLEFMEVRTEGDSVCNLGGNKE